MALLLEYMALSIEYMALLIEYMALTLCFKPYPSNSTMPFENSFF